MTALIRVLTHERKDRVRYCLPSIAAGMRDGDALHIIDDASTEYDVEWLENLVPRFDRIIHRMAKSDHDMENLRRDDLEWFNTRGGYDMLCCVDSDALCHPQWLDEAKRLIERYGLAVSMFNPGLHHKDYTLGEFDGAIIRTLGQGVCLCLSSEHVETVLRKTSADQMIAAGWDWVASRALGKVCVSNPSMVEHLGWGGAHSPDHTIDNFGDYAMNLHPELAETKEKVLQAIRKNTESTL